LVRDSKRLAVGILVGTAAGTAGILVDMAAESLADTDMGVLRGMAGTAVESLADTVGILQLPNVQ
jgi:hypothetical protein